MSASSLQPCMLSKFLNTNLPTPSLSGHTTNLFSHNTQLASHSLFSCSHNTNLADSVCVVSHVCLAVFMQFMPIPVWSLWLYTTFDSFKS